MRTLIILVMILYAFYAFSEEKISCKNEKNAKISSNTKSVVISINEFAFSIFEKLREKKKGNIFFSPLSLEFALGMTYGGAASRTKEEMKKVLRFEPEDSTLFAGFKQLYCYLNSLQKEKGFSLFLANSLWMQKGYKFKKSFLNMVNRYFDGKFFTVNFKKKAEEARKKINEYVKRITRGKISELFKKGILDSTVRLVLVNAIYFKGLWKYMFDRGKTEQRNFYISETNVVKIPFMYVFKKFYYFESKNYKMVELPYKNGKVSMVVILPRKGEEEGFESTVSLKKIMRGISLMRKEKVKVYLPKFKIESSFELSSVLYEMGMKLAFTNAADFSNMVPKPVLKISKVVHKAYIEVDEKGTEAAAATGVVMKVKGMKPRPLKIHVFKADHPFLFLIIDNQLKTILFFGRFKTPQ